MGPDRTTQSCARQVPERERCGLSQTTQSAEKYGRVSEKELTESRAPLAKLAAADEKRRGSDNSQKQAMISGRCTSRVRYVPRMRWTLLLLLVLTLTSRAQNTATESNITTLPLTKSL